MTYPKTTRGLGLLEGFLANKRAQRANSLIPHSLHSGRILDIGCGAYPAFLQLTDFSEKYGIDKTYSNLWELEFKDRPIKLILHDIETERSLPFPNEHFDTVTMLAVLEHIAPENLIKVSQESWRVLKHGGLLIITTPAKWTGFILNTLSRLGLISRHEIKDHKILHTSDSIIRTLRQGGFTSADIEFGYFEFRMNIWVKAIKQMSIVQ